MLTSVSLVAAIAMNVASRSPVSYSRRIHSIEPSDAKLAQLGLGLGRDQDDAAVAGQQALDLLQADLAAAHDDAAPARELQARDVERRVEHVAHAGLVTDPAPVLADALFPCIGLSRHVDYHRTNCEMEHYFDDSSLLRQVVGHRLDRALRSARPAGDGRAPGRVRRLLRPHRRARRSLRAAAAHRDRDGRGRVRHQGARRQADRARARHAPDRVRRADRGGRPVPGRARPTAPTIPSSCCGSWPRWPSRRCSSTASYVRSLSHDELDALWADYRVVGRQLRPARARHAARHRRLPRLHGRHVRQRRAVRHAGGARAGDRHRHAPAGAADGQAAGRAGQPDHDRLAARATSAASTASTGTRCGRVALRGGAAYVKRAGALLGRAGIELRLPGRSPEPA